MRLNVANDGSIDGNQPHLINVHVCIYCGYLLKWEEVDSRQVAPGIFHCSKCDLDGPLNVEIREVPELEMDRSDLRGSESSSQR